MPTLLQSFIDGLLGIVFMKELESLSAFFRTPIKDTVILTLLKNLWYLNAPLALIPFFW